MADYSDILRKISAQLPSQLMELEQARRDLRDLWPELEKIRRDQAALRSQVEKLTRGESIFTLH